VISRIRTDGGTPEERIFRRVTVTLPLAAALALDALARETERGRRPLALALLVDAIEQRLRLHQVLAEPPDPAEPRSLAPRRRAAAARELRAAARGRGR